MSVVFRSAPSYEMCPACGTPCAFDKACPECRQRAAEDRVGTTLSGRYRIDGVIGRGGFGVVYRATNLALGLTVAVKFLLAEWAKLPETRARFEREAAALVRLRHPGIVGALDFGEDAGDLFLVMEWVPGQDLGKQVCVDGQTLPESRIIGILDQVLQVLEVAHAQGIVHRDLKPENVMLVNAGDGVERVKVLDFGLVLISDTSSGKRLTASNAVNGTCYYMAPEQCRGRDVGPPADIYAIGCMLYELLCGEPPFMGETSVDVMMQQLAVEPPPIRERGVRREPSPALEAIARQCLQKNPASRPSALQLRSELQAALRGTDAVTRAHQDARTRVAAAAMSRGDRAIGKGPAEFVGTEAHVAPVSLRREDHPTVVVWGYVAGTAERMRGVLGLQGIHAETWSSPGIPMVEAARAIMIAGDEKAEARTAALRASPDTAKVPVLVTGVLGADRTPGLIRSGASDVCLASVGDDVVAQKLWRLIRRKR
jgi:serine/threonine-protein kinase